jgi:ribosome-binding factor A
MQRLKLCRYCIKLSNDLAIANVFVGNTSGKAAAVALSELLHRQYWIVAIVNDAVTTRF